MVEKKDKLKLCIVSCILIIVSGYLSTVVTNALDVINPQQDNWAQVEAFIEPGIRGETELEKVLELSVQSKRASDAALADLMFVLQWLGIILLVIAVVHVVIVVGPFQRSPGVGPTGKSSD